MCNNFLTFGMRFFFEPGEESGQRHSLEGQGLWWAAAKIGKP